MHGRSHAMQTRIVCRGGLVPRLITPCIRVRQIATSTPWRAPNLQLPPRPKVGEDEFSEVFLKGSGPGGQKINKTSSAVQLHHNATGIVVKSQATRSRTQNRKIARQLLAEKLEERDVLERRTSLENDSGKTEYESSQDKTRKELKADRVRKKKASADKKKRRKYRALEEAKGKQNGGTADDVEDTSFDVTP